MLRFRPLVSVAMVLLAAAAVNAQSGTPNQSPAQMLAQAKPKAIEQVLLSSRSDNPFLRANAIEAIHPVVERARPMAQLGLKDPHPAVRFAAAVTIGKLRISGMQGAIGDVLKDSDPSVRAAALYAAAQLGMQIDISELANCMASPEVGVRSNAAMLLALLGDRGAVPMMKELGQLPLSRRVSPARNAVYRVQLAEALVQLGDEQGFEGLRAGAFSSYDEVRVVAVQAMGRVQDQAMAPALQRIQATAPIQVRLAAAQALAQLGRPVDVGLVLQGAAYSAEEVLTQARSMARQGMERSHQAYVGTLLQDAQAREQAAAAIRAEAAFVLGLANNPAAISKLVSLLDDRSEQVRLSAAAAILRERPAGALAQP